MKLIKLTKVILDQPPETLKEFVFINIDSVTSIERSLENEHKRTRVFTLDGRWFEVEETMDDIWNMMMPKEG